MKSVNVPPPRWWDFPERLPVPFLHLSIATGYLLVIVLALGAQNLLTQARLYQETRLLAERSDAQLQRLETL